MTSSIRAMPGQPTPLGSNPSAKGVNFAIKSAASSRMSLCLFTSSKVAICELPFDPILNKTNDTWHIFLENLPIDTLYLFKTDISPNLLIDPYAKEIITTNIWKAPQNQQYFPFSAIAPEEAFDWQNTTSPAHALQDLIIYEMHVRGFTKHSSSKIDKAGSYLGMIEKIPHLIELGVNAVELLPIHEFNEQENHRINPITLQSLCNYWGYSTVNFFSPMQRYTSDINKTLINQFKSLVRELHRNKIEVILDVVYNHTAEGSEKGPIFCFKGLDNSSYYLMDQFGHQNFSGCGNTVNCNNPLSIELILNSLRYWVTEMRVDGFRFDLAPILSRGLGAAVLKNPPLLEAISSDPILSKIKLIAEPWDAGGLYQVGTFYQSNRWSEWNDKYRDSVRNFIKGTGNKNDFSACLCGSQNTFPQYSPLRSINFITAHDGFNLHDLVSYNEKHNLANAEDNRDGINHNVSWNCGVEGKTQDAQILALRERQMRNFHVALMVSQGVPMVLMGDEYGHTKNGNNNTWCQDNELNWFLWDELESNAEFFRFYKKLIDFRKQHSILRRRHFLTANDVEWHGKALRRPDWSDLSNNLIAFTLKDHKNDNDLYIAFNANSNPCVIEFPEHPTKKWHWIVNTASPSPYDIREGKGIIPIVNTQYRMLNHSAIILKLLNF